MTTATNTIQLHRVLRATPEKIYRAFLAQMQWSNGFRRMDSPERFTKMDAKVGGSYKMSFTNFN